MWGCILNFFRLVLSLQDYWQALFLQNKVVCLQREVTKADSFSSTLPLKTERLSIAAETQMAHFSATFFKQHITKQFCAIFFSAWMQTYQLKLHVQLTQNKKLRLLSMSIIFFIALRRYKIKEFKNFSFSSPRFHILQSPFSFSPADSVLLGFFWTWGDYYEIERIEVTEVRNENRRAIPLCPPNPF